MESFDDMDIDDLLENPLKNVKLGAGKPPTRKAGKSEKPARARPLHVKMPREEPVSAEDIERMERNHPLESRVLSLEKNLVASDEKLDTLKRIIGEQNERIAKIEEELDIIREHLGGGKSAGGNEDGGEKK